VEWGKKEKWRQHKYWPNRIWPRYGADWSAGFPGQICMRNVKDHVLILQSHDYWPAVCAGGVESYFFWACFVFRREPRNPFCSTDWLTMWLNLVVLVHSTRRRVRMIGRVVRLLWSRSARLPRAILVSQITFMVGDWSDSDDSSRWVPSRRRSAQFAYTRVVSYSSGGGGWKLGRGGLGYVTIISFGKAFGLSP